MFVCVCVSEFVFAAAVCYVCVYVSGFVFCRYTLLYVRVGVSL